MSRDEDTRQAPGERAAEGMAGLAKGLAVVEAFGPDRPRLTVSDAARATGTSPATARRCLLTLQELGYVSHDGKYFLPTPRMVRLGAAYLQTASLPLLAQSHVLAARDELDESVSLAVLEGGQSVFVARAEVARIVSAGVRVGAQLPAHASATGRVLLAGLADAEVEQILAAAELQQTTPNTLMDRARIRERIEQARREDAAYTDQELELGVRTMAVPVRDATGRTRAALAVAVFAARSTMEDLRTIHTPVLHRHATRLGRML